MILDFYDVTFANMYSQNFIPVLLSFLCIFICMYSFYSCYFFIILLAFISFVAMYVGHSEIIEILTDQTRYRAQIFRPFQGNLHYNPYRVSALLTQHQNS